MKQQVDVLLKHFYGSVNDLVIALDQARDIVIYMSMCADYSTVRWTTIIISVGKVGGRALTPFDLCLLTGTRASGRMYSEFMIELRKFSIRIYKK